MCYHFSDSAPHLLKNCVRSRNVNWREVLKTSTLSLLTAGFLSWTPTPGTWGRVLVLLGPSGPPPERNPTSSLAADWAPYWGRRGGVQVGRSSEKSTALSCCVESTTSRRGREFNLWHHRGLTHEYERRDKARDPWDAWGLIVTWSRRLLSCTHQQRSSQMRFFYSPTWSKFHPSLQLINSSKR